MFELGAFVIKPALPQAWVRRQPPGSVATVRALQFRGAKFDLHFELGSRDAEPGVLQASGRGGRPPLSRAKRVVSRDVIGSTTRAPSVGAHGRRSKRHRIGQPLTCCRPAHGGSCWHQVRVESAAGGVARFTARNYESEHHIRPIEGGVGFAVHTVAA